MNTKYAARLFTPLTNEKGSTIIYAIIVLLLLTIIGISSVNTTTTEQAIAQNDMYYKLSFYAAEAGKEFVPPNTQLYHTDNVIVGSGIDFPSIDFPNADGLDNDGDGSIDNETEVIINSIQSFDGNVVYDGSAQPPRGSGYDVGSYKSHKYTITANGHGPRSTDRSIEAGFYRIGF